MGKFGLQFCATLENITSFSGKEEGLVWALKFKCSNCQEETPNFQEFSLLERIQTSTGHGTCHLFMSCKVCKKKMQITILPECLVDYKEKDSESFKTIAAFDCRGAEPVTCKWSEGWVVKTKGGKTFGKVDLWDDQRDWVEYDEKIKEAVSINDMRYQFVKM